MPCSDPHERASCSGRYLSGCERARRTWARPSARRASPCNASSVPAPRSPWPSTCMPLSWLSTRAMLQRARPLDGATRHQTVNSLWCKAKRRWRSSAREHLVHAAAQALQRLEGPVCHAAPVQQVRLHRVCTAHAWIAADVGHEVADYHAEAVLPRHIEPGADGSPPCSVTSAWAPQLGRSAVQHTASAAWGGGGLTGRVIGRCHCLQPRTSAPLIGTARTAGPIAVPESH